MIPKLMRRSAVVQREAIGVSVLTRANGTTRLRLRSYKQSCRPYARISAANSAKTLEIRYPPTNSDIPVPYLLPPYDKLHSRLRSQVRT
eukprot:3716919-Rhodomonas_salina.1